MHGSFWGFVGFGADLAFSGSQPKADFLFPPFGRWLRLVLPACSRPSKGGLSL